MAVEEAKYAVVRKEQAFELRVYEPHVLAETVVDGAFDSAGNKAFRRLFGYISGNNTSRNKIAMTAPVGQGTASEKIEMTSPVGQKREGGRWAVSFMMPASYTLDALPQPDDPTVSLRHVPARHVAAVRYSGFWSGEAYRKHRDQLEAWIESQGLNVIGDAEFARYDAPFKPWFMRRNEVLIPVSDPMSSA